MGILRGDGVTKLDNPAEPREFAHTFRLGQGWLWVLDGQDGRRAGLAGME